MQGGAAAFFRLNCGVTCPEAMLEYASTVCNAVGEGATWRRSHVECGVSYGQGCVGGRRIHRRTAARGAEARAELSPRVTVPCDGRRDVHSVRVSRVWRRANSLLIDASGFSKMSFFYNVKARALTAHCQSRGTHGSTGGAAVARS